MQLKKTIVKSHARPQELEGKNKLSHVSGIKRNHLILEICYSGLPICMWRIINYKWKCPSASEQSHITWSLKDNYSAITAGPFKHLMTPRCALNILNMHWLCSFCSAYLKIWRDEIIMYFMKPGWLTRLHVLKSEALWSTSQFSTSCHWEIIGWRKTLQAF